MNKIFVLYNSDIFYATRFMEYFNYKQETEFKISVFTQKESFMEFINRNYVEILLLEDLSHLEDINLDNIRYIYNLTEKPSKESNSSYPQIYKLQSVKTVMNDILSDYKIKVNSTNCLTCKENGIKIITVFSPVPCIENTMFAWILGSIISEQENALLILFELLPVQFIDTVDISGSFLTELIYFLKENIDISEKIKLFQRWSHSNLYYLSGINNGSDLLSLTTEDIEKLIKELTIHKIHQSVVFYVSYFTEAVAQLMNLSNAVFTISSDSAYEVSVQKEWERQMSLMGLRRNMDKFQTITLMKEENIKQLPITSSDLGKSEMWNKVREFLNS